MFKLYVPNEFGKKDVEEFATRAELEARMLELAKEDAEGLDGDYYDEQIKDSLRALDWEEVEMVYSILDPAANEVWPTSYRTHEAAEAAVAEAGVNADDFEIFEEDDLTAMARHNKIEG